MIFSHGFCCLWSGMMNALNLGVVVVAVILGWLYLFFAIGIIFFV